MGRASFLFFGRECELERLILSPSKDEARRRAG